MLVPQQPCFHLIILTLSSLANVFACCTGSQIAQQVIASSFFQAARSVGLYITCERLREVDTMTLLTAALQQGKQAMVGWVFRG